MSTQAQSKEPWVEENPRTNSEWVEKGQVSGPVSPPRSTETPWAQGPTSADGEADQPAQPGTIEGVKAPQPQVTATEEGKAHHLLGPEPVEATTNEDVRSVRADPSAATPSAPSPDMPTTSAQQVEEDDVVLVTGLGTQL